MAKKPSEPPPSPSTEPRASATGGDIRAFPDDMEITLPSGRKVRVGELKKKR